MLSSKARDAFRGLTEPTGRLLARVGVTPDALTVAGLLGAVAAAALVGLGHTRIGGLVMLVAALADMLDGAVAKAAGQASRWGAFLDSVTDRLSDAAVLAAVVWLGAEQASPRIAVLAAAVLAGSLIVSYVKARAESLGFGCDVGIAERPERVIVLGGALLFGVLEAGLWLLAAGTAVTVGQRIWTVRRQSAAARTPEQEPRR